MKLKELFRQAQLIIRRPPREIGLPLFLFLGSAFGLFYWNVQFISEIQSGALAINRAGVQLWKQMLEQELEQRTLELSYAALLDSELMAALGSDESGLAVPDAFFERHPIADKLFVLNEDSMVIAEAETIFDGGEFESLRSMLDQRQGPGVLVSQAFQYEGQYYQAIAVHDLNGDNSSAGQPQGHGLLVDMGWVQTELLPLIQTERGLVGSGNTIRSARLVMPSVEELAGLPSTDTREGDSDRVIFPIVDLETSDAAIADGMSSLRGALIFQGIVSGLFLSVMVLMGIHLLRTRRALELAERRNAVVGATSHALRTPLTIISLYAETLKGSNELSESDMECSAIIARESGRLLHQLEDGLNFARIAAGKQEYRMTQVDLNEVAQASLSVHEHYLDDSGYTVAPLVSPDPLPIRADSSAVAFAIDNVIQNAIKYSKDAKYLGVATYREKDTAVVEITDHGIGIPVAEQADIFKEFHRASTASSTESGWGLGLYIVKHVVDGHGARIEVDSEVGWGTQVRIYFPLELGVGERDPIGTPQPNRDETHEMAVAAMIENGKTSHPEGVLSVDNV